MAVLSKKYRIIWIIETKVILNDYKKNYLDSVTLHPDDGPNTYFESDVYQDILNKINTEGLKELKDVPPPPPPTND